MFVRFVSFRVRTFSDVEYILFQSIPVSRASPRCGSARATSSTWFPRARVQGCSTSWPSTRARRTTPSTNTCSCSVMLDSKVFLMLKFQDHQSIASTTSTLQQLILIMLISFQKRKISLVHVWAHESIINLLCLALIKLNLLMARVWAHDRVTRSSWHQNPSLLDA